MAAWEEAMAFRHAPILLQKVHDKHDRADFITQVNFAHDWKEIYKNWDALWEKKADGSLLHVIASYGYYSIVETHTHFFLLFAFYHPQDWAAFWGSPSRSRPKQPDQHLHDMEGCLVVVPKYKDEAIQRCEAVLTVSHFHFYSYAGWEFDSESPQPPARDIAYRVTGWLEDRDGPILGTARFAVAGGRRPRGEPDEPPYRFKLHAHSGSHAIRGDKKDWGDEKRIVRYRPSLVVAEEPQSGVFEREEDASFQTVRYRLESIFAEDGLWAHHNDPWVFQTNDKGQEAFADIGADGSGLPVASSANPPWGWDDTDDRNKVGEFAWNPAHLVDNYFGGLKEFSKEYVHNPYIGVHRDRA